MTKNFLIAALSLLLLASIVIGVVLYERYSNSQTAILTSDNRLRVLNDKVAQLEKKNSSLQEEVSKYAGRTEELGNTKKRVAELSGVVESKEHQLSDITEKLNRLEKECLAEKQKNAEIVADLSSKGSMVEELKKEIQDKDAVISQCRGQLGDAQAQTASLRQALEKTQKQIQSLQNQLTELQKEKESTETRLNQLTSTSKAGVDELKQKIASGQRQVAELQARLSELGGEKAQIKTKIDRMESSYESLLSDLKKQIANKEVTIQRIKGRMTITFVDRILFGLGRATITPEGKETLKKVGKTLRNVGDKMIKVVGHTDDIPIMEEYRWKFPSNWELSTDRAAAVVRYFQEMGVNPANMEAVGRSFYDTTASNETPEGRARNRRVDIIIAPKIAPDFKRQDNEEEEKKGHGDTGKGASKIQQLNIKSEVSHLAISYYSSEPKLLLIKRSKPHEPSEQKFLTTSTDDFLKKHKP